MNKDIIFFSKKQNVFKDENIISAYYQLIQHPKHKDRYIVGNGNYKVFEKLRGNKDELLFYWNNPSTDISAIHPKRKTYRFYSFLNERAKLYMFSKSIGVGYINHTSDALILTKGKKTIEIFITKNQKNNILQLYDLYTKGELDVNIEILRQKRQNNPFSILRCKFSLI